MIKTIVGGIIAAITIGGFGWLSGYSMRDQQARVEAKIAEMKFIKEKLEPAAKAYAEQKVIDDRELEVLRKKASEAPENPMIVIKKDMAGRIGAIR
jgi:hypothetical protein